MSDLKFKVCMNGSFPITRPYSVENNDGFIAGTYRQYVERNNLPISCIRQASLSKVEALNIVEELNYRINDETTIDDINSFLWSL